MLFVALLKKKISTKETLPRRLEWQAPEGVRTVAEYWLLTPDPNVILAFEGESIAPMEEAISAWDDVFDITIVPAITAEDGIKVAKQRMPH